VVSQSRLGAVYAYAPRAYRARFNQLAYVRTVRSWRETGRFGEIEAAASGDPALVFDVSWRRTGVGPNGYPDGFELTYSVDPEYVAPGTAPGGALDDFGAALLDALHGAIESEPPADLDARPFGVVLAVRTADEAAAADAFGIDEAAVSGTVAGVESRIADGELDAFGRLLERFGGLSDVRFAVATDIVGALAEAELPVALDDGGYAAYGPATERRAGDVEDK
jgi:hypothetical protein